MAVGALKDLGALTVGTTQGAVGRPLGSLAFTETVAKGCQFVPSPSLIVATPRKAYFPKALQWDGTD